MSAPLCQALRFVRASIRPTTPLQTREVLLDTGKAAGTVPATLVEGEGTGPRPGWVVLHGITRPGRHHPALRRFVGGVAAAGGRILIPEIPPWRELEFAPEVAQGVIGAAVRTLARDPKTRGGKVTLLGFSFGVPQALLFAAGAEESGVLRSVVGWGGYTDLERTFRFQFTGRHEWEGKKYHLRPDPYGRWVVGANTLRLELGLGDTRPVAEALRALATEAGSRQIMAWDHRLAPLERDHRRRLPTELRPLYDLFVPPRGSEPDPAAVESLLERMVPAVRRELPLLEPIPGIRGVSLPIRLLHPRSDHLIPFTETLALARRLEGRAPDLSADVLGLLGHSGRGAVGGIAGLGRDGLAFLHALAGVFEAGG